MEMNRVNELMANMNSFGKEAYYKSELLSEMFNLQSEMVALTFNNEDSETANLKILDVERYLEQLNRECGNVADEELRKFEEGSKDFCNLLRAEISGSKGEAKAFRALQNIQSVNRILRNVELKDGDARTEIDAVVITPGVVTIIEVKNTSKNIFIDENGDYYRTGEFLKWDCNIAGKMELKERLLRKALVAERMEDIQIRSIVVFTDNRIEVQNKYSRIRTCFLSQLAYIINGFKNDSNYSDEKMAKIENVIRNAECSECYPFEFDVAQYKFDFATLLAILEDASVEVEAEYEEETNYKEVSEAVETKRVKRDGLKLGFVSRRVMHAGIAAAAAVALVSTVALSSIKRV